MKKFLPVAILILIILSAIYLNRSYAYFFDYIGNHFVGNPNYVRVSELGRGTLEIKLMTLGDSLLAGTCTRNPSNVLANLIAQSFALDGQKVTLLNLAVPGAGVKDVLEEQVPEALEQNPDFIVLMVGVNDVHDLKIASYFKEYYTQILKQLNQTKAKVTLITIPYLGSDLVLFPPWDVNIESETENFNYIINSLAQDYGLKVIDLHDKFKNDFKKTSKLYCSDQFHPSDEGYKAWANYINANISR